MRPALVVTLALGVLLAVTTLAYWPVLTHGFCTLDDPSYVVRNVHVRQGLTVPTVVWAFRSFELMNWHPLTWLSHALDCRLFGLRSGGHHFTSLALHVLNVALVFFALRALTGAAGRSLAAAALFALHPMNVESVAWIAERKNVLSGTFFAATLIAYAAYARSSTWGRYVIVTVLIALGLLAKPMLVTLPFVLLLMDVWPLERLRRGTIRSVLMEKLPWLFLCVASSAVTYRAQSRGHAVVALGEHPLRSRACVAVTGYVEYLGKLVWPSHLAIFYPYISPSTVACVLGSFALMVFLVVAWLALRRSPHWFVGGAWFLGMLVPVCGLVQVGAQRIADRYVYHPMIGIAMAVVFGAWALIPRRVFWAAAMLLVCAVLAWRTRVELNYWGSNPTLFARALEVTGRNCWGNEYLGIALRDQGNDAGAVAHLAWAAEDCPDLGEAHGHLGALLAKHGQFARAIPHFAVARELLAEPESIDMSYNLALALWYEGRADDARRVLRRTLAVAPGHLASVELLRKLESPSGTSARP